MKMGAVSFLIWPFNLSFLGAGLRPAIPPNFL